MEKDIGKIPKNQDTDIIVRIDDFGGKVGLTIREFVKGERYTGFTKAGTRIPADKFKEFKEMINSIKDSDISVPPTTTPITSTESSQQAHIPTSPSPAKKETKSKVKKSSSPDIDDMAM